MNALALLGALAVLVPLLYMWAASAVAARFPATAALRNKRICLLIAHPDDEAMFFAPAVLALTRPETGNHVKILCLSRGDAAGLGATRARELVKSARTLGLRHDDDVFVVDSPNFPDSMTTSWDSQTLAALLASAFAPAVVPAAAAGGAPASPPRPPPPGAPPADPTIDVLITFDGRGVSGHPNHISLYRGARRFVATLDTLLPGKDDDDEGGGAAATPAPPRRRHRRPPVDLYTLTTVPLLRKYTWVLDLVPTLGAWAWQRLRAAQDWAVPGHPDRLVFCARLDPSAAGGGLGTAWRAMTRAHVSQMVWFRYGWIALSRYMVINDLQLERDFGPDDFR